MIEAGDVLQGRLEKYLAAAIRAVPNFPTRTANLTVFGCCRCCVGTVDPTIAAPAFTSYCSVRAVAPSGRFVDEEVESCRVCLCHCCVGKLIVTLSVLLCRIAILYLIQITTTRLNM